jgi:hypothetical protein
MLRALGGPEAHARTLADPKVGKGPVRTCSDSDAKM